MRWVIALDGPVFFGMLMADLTAPERGRWGPPFAVHFLQ